MNNVSINQKSDVVNIMLDDNDKRNIINDSKNPGLMNKYIKQLECKIF